MENALNFLAIWKDIDKFTVVDSLIVSLIAIITVFAVLALIIFIAWIAQKGMDKVEAKTHILPKAQNKILESDDDAVAAVLAATIDFYKETGKEPVVKSITKIEE